MSEQRNDDNPSPAVSEAPGQGDAQDPHQEEAFSASDAEAILAAARDDQLEVPVGAEDLAAALLHVAAERDQHLAKLQRTAADFQNFQRRAHQNEAEARRGGTHSVVQSLLAVLDYFDMALKQNPETATAEQVIGGVQMIKAELVRVLGAHGVGVLTPTTGEAFDPNRHEAVERRSAGGEDTLGAAPNTVVSVVAPGYTLGDRVARPARVIVAVEPEPEASSADAATDAGAEDQAGE